MIEISEIKVSLKEGATEQAALAAGMREAARLLSLAPADIAHNELHRTSIDARKKSDVHFTVSVRFGLRDGLDQAGVLARADAKAARRIRIVDEDSPSYPAPLSKHARPALRPVVVGAGCAGLFAALTLAEAGLEPLLIERGDNAADRTRAVEHFNATGELDLESNIQFGLGGAGTFSDGKLTTGTKNPAHHLILQTLVDAGAPREILWEAKPHVGSDILPGVVTHMVARIRDLGGEVLFRTRLVDIDRGSSGQVEAVHVSHNSEDEERIACSHLILACGHSARDVFELLDRRGFELARKTFAVGARIEHLQADIDRSQYGPAAGHPALGAAPYKLVAHTKNGRSLFSFCMCPGGEVVAAASEAGGVVTNGASLHARAGKNANAALLVNVNPQDLPGDDVLAGIRLQRECERMAYELGGGAYKAPAQLVGDFLCGIPSVRGGKVTPTYPRGVTWGSINMALPQHVTETMRMGIPELARRLRGFDDEEAVLTGVESRSSSPVRILRGEDFQSPIRGLYPCGEGAGYAGGITSAAVDGIRVAEAIASK